MAGIPHWIRDESGRRAFLTLTGYPEFRDLVERVDAITVVVPYFQQAASVLLFAKANTNNYPSTMRGLRDADDALIAEGAYEDLSEGAKAKLLRDTAAEKLGITL